MAPKRKLAAATAKAAALSSVLGGLVSDAANSGFMLGGLPCVCVAR